MQVIPYDLSVFKLFKRTLGAYLIFNYILFFRELLIFLPGYNNQTIWIPGYLPSAWILNSTFAKGGVIGMLILGILSSGFFGLHKRHKIAALVVFICWNIILNFHPWVYLPQDGYIGWFLLATLLIPEETEAPWIMPLSVWKLAWFITGLSYFTSAWSKFFSESWADGWAMSVILNFPHTRVSFITEFLSSLPAGLLQGLTWFVIVIEAIILPLSFFETGRKISWYLLLASHLFILITVDITSVTCAFLALHLFIYRSGWLPTLKKAAHEY